jgi:hypothetical protein
VKTAVEYIMLGSSTHVTNSEKKKISFVDRTEDSSDVIMQKKDATELDRNDLSFTDRKNTLSNPVEAASSATTVYFCGRKANGLTYSPASVTRRRW